MLEYLTLFSLALLSATLLPGGSEAYLLYLQHEQFPLILIWSVATIGNTLGSIINYGLGRYLLHFQEKRWFPVTTYQLEKSEKWFQRYGKWSLLLAWAPIIGDGLTLIAGVLKINIWTFTVLVAIGKGLRYAFVLGIMGFFLG